MSDKQNINNNLKTTADVLNGVADFMEKTADHSAMNQAVKNNIKTHSNNSTNSTGFSTNNGQNEKIQSQSAYNTQQHDFSTIGNATYQTIAKTVEETEAGEGKRELDKHLDIAKNVTGINVIVDTTQRTNVAYDLRHREKYGIAGLADKAKEWGKEKAGINTLKVTDDDMKEILGANNYTAFTDAKAKLDSKTIDKNLQSINLYLEKNGINGKTLNSQEMKDVIKKWEAGYDEKKAHLINIGDNKIKLDDNIVKVISEKQRLEKARAKISNAPTGGAAGVVKGVGSNAINLSTEAMRDSEFDTGLQNAKGTVKIAQAGVKVTKATTGAAITGGSAVLQGANKIEAGVADTLSRVTTGKVSDALKNHSSNVLNSNKNISIKTKEVTNFINSSTTDKAKIVGAAAGSKVKSAGKWAVGNTIGKTDIGKKVGVKINESSAKYKLISNANHGKATVEDFSKLEKLVSKRKLRRLKRTNKIAKTFNNIKGGISNAKDKLSIINNKINPIKKASTAISFVGTLINKLKLYLGIGACVILIACAILPMIFGALGGMAANLASVFGFFSDDDEEAQEETAGMIQDGIDDIYDIVNDSVTDMEGGDIPDNIETVHYSATGVDLDNTNLSSLFDGTELSDIKVPVKYKGIVTYTAREDIQYDRETFLSDAMSLDKLKEICDNSSPQIEYTSESTKESICDSMETWLEDNPESSLKQLVLHENEEKIVKGYANTKGLSGDGEVVRATSGDDSNIYHAETGSTMTDVVTKITDESGNEYMLDDFYKACCSMGLVLLQNEHESGDKELFIKFCNYLAKNAIKKGELNIKIEVEELQNTKGTSEGVQWKMPEYPDIIVEDVSVETNAKRAKITCTFTFDGDIYTLMKKCTTGGHGWKNTNVWAHENGSGSTLYDETDPESSSYHKFTNWYKSDLSSLRQNGSDAETIAKDPDLWENVTMPNGMAKKLSQAEIRSIIKQLEEEYGDNFTPARKYMIEKALGEVGKHYYLYTGGHGTYTRYSQIPVGLDCSGFVGVACWIGGANTSKHHEPGGACTFASRYTGVSNWVNKMNRKELLPGCIIVRNGEAGGATTSSNHVVIYAGYFSYPEGEAKAHHTIECTTRGDVSGVQILTVNTNYEHCRDPFAGRTNGEVIRPEMD